MVIFSVLYSTWSNLTGTFLMPFDIKIDPAQFAKIEKRIRDDANEILSGSALKQEVGEFAVERIKYQARIGKPLNSDGTFPLLRDATIMNRIRLAKYNKVHPTYEDGFSNLTLTGELLESLNWTDSGETSLTLKFVGNHSPYKSAKGVIERDDLPNATLVEYLAAKGFVVFDKSLQSNRQFISRIKTICLRYIRRGLRIRSKLGADDSD